MFRWATRTLVLPEKRRGADCSAHARRARPSHAALLLPVERSPYWRPELRAAVSGMSLATEPLEILQACLESVALRFKQIYLLLTRPFAAPAQVIASGGALLNFACLASDDGRCVGPPGGRVASQKKRRAGAR